MTKFPVNYGVNNSHITEWKMFDKYKDAVAFLDNLPEGFKTGIIYKWQPKLNSYWQTFKKAKFEPGVDNTRLLERIQRSENGRLL